MSAVDIVGRPVVAWEAYALHRIAFWSTIKTEVWPDNVRCIEGLLAEIVRLRAAAEALADLLPTPLCGESWDLPDTETVAITTTFGKLRAARESLAALSQGDR